MEKRWKNYFMFRIIFFPDPFGDEMLSLFPSSGRFSLIKPESHLSGKLCRFRFGTRLKDAVFQREAFQLGCLACGCFLKFWFCKDLRIEKWVEMFLMTFEADFLWVYMDLFLLREKSLQNFLCSLGNFKKSPPFLQKPSLLWIIIW